MLLHLLKWRVQPGGRGSSWRGSIEAQRRRIALVLRDSPSLRRYPTEVVDDVYDGARVKAAEQTGLAIELFPATCPFSETEVLDRTFFPEYPASE